MTIRLVPWRKAIAQTSTVFESPRIWLMTEDDFCQVLSSWSTNSVQTYRLKIPLNLMRCVESRYSMQISKISSQKPTSLPRAPIYALSFNNPTLKHRTSLKARLRRAFSSTICNNNMFISSLIRERRVLCSSPGIEGGEPSLIAAQDSWTGWVSQKPKAAMKTFEKGHGYQREMSLLLLSYK